MLKNQPSFFFCIISFSHNLQFSKGTNLPFLSRPQQAYPHSKNIDGYTGYRYKDRQAYMKVGRQVGMQVDRQINEIKYFLCLTCMKQIHLPTYVLVKYIYAHILFLKFYQGINRKLRQYIQTYFLIFHIRKCDLERLLCIRVLSININTFINTCKGVFLKLFNRLYFSRQFFRDN